MQTLTMKIDETHFYHILGKISKAINNCHFYMLTFSLLLCMLLEDLGPQ